ncbi:hypothetical protein U9M48_027398 [Paspalum notatum var. saurae]|uniref:Uncharacterized protein n=1 Tax=Paspalum notatum var. saurae TaxID=547442 RepID=A0AAQ3X032_PASNO
MEDVGLDGPNVRRRPGRSIKSFYEWIEHEPKEKWSLLHDEGGARYGIMTTNLARGVQSGPTWHRSMPLVGIVEFYIYRTTQYFRERYPKAEKVFTDHGLIYGRNSTSIWKKQTKKPRGHRVGNMGVGEHRFEVLCRDKGRRGGNHERHVQECVLYNNHCVRTCHKPRLYHRPCTHSEIYGFAMAGNFTGTPDGAPDFIPNPHPDMKQRIGRRKTRRIRNNMDDAEARPRVVICSGCNEFGHSYKKCNSTAQGTTGNIHETGSSSQAARCGYGHEASVVLRSCFGLFAWTVPCTGADGDDGFGPSLVTEVTCFGPAPPCSVGRGRPTTFRLRLLPPGSTSGRMETGDTHFPPHRGRDGAYVAGRVVHLGLPLRGDAMGPTDVGQGWREDLRLGSVVCGVAAPHRPTGSSHRRTRADHQSGGSFGSSWCDEYEIARHLEAYVLWLMGWVMFCGSAGGFVPKHLLRFARYVADAPPEAIPRFGRGSAVLAATYRGLCTGCLKSSGAEPIFGGVRYFCSYGLTRGSGLVGPRFYTCHTGGTRWTTSTARQWALCGATNEYLSALTLKLNASRFAYAHVRTRKSYPDFVGRFDVLRDDEVRWEPYSREACWRTRGPRVFDIYVEEHAVHRVLRRFGLFREIVVLRAFYLHTRTGS